MTTYRAFRDAKYVVTALLICASVLYAAEFASDSTVVVGRSDTTKSDRYTVDIHVRMFDRWHITHIQDASNTELQVIDTLRFLLPFSVYCVFSLCVLCVIRSFARMNIYRGVPRRIFYKV